MMNPSIDEESYSAATNTVPVLPVEATTPESSIGPVSNLESPDRNTPSETMPTTNDQRFCGADTKSGRPCRNPVGKGTTHLGQGRCKYHGGATPIKNGLFSNVRRTRLGKRIGELAEFRDLQQRADKVAALLAILEEKVDEYQKRADELHAWHRAETPAYQKMLNAKNSSELIQAVRELKLAEQSRPSQPPDPTVIVSIAETVSRMEERYHRMDRICSAAELEVILQRLGAVVNDYVADEKIKAKIREGWENLMLEVV
jgi:hypothetical protein